jgi:predicted esterase
MGGRGGSAGAAGTGGAGVAGGAGGGGTGGAAPLLPRTSGRATFAIPGRTETAIDLVVPAGLGASPPLVIAFHPTGGEPSEAISDFELDQNATRYKFVAVAPRAGYRNGVHPADVDHELNGGDSSWNMWAQGVAANEDLRYVLALIDSAHATFNVDMTRVYTVGFSNGAFFAYFAAASLPDRIAGFAENSGGWTTRSCPTAYGSSSYQQSSSSVPSGTAIACSTLFSDASFPLNCQFGASNPLTAPPLGARIPFGYLAHYSSDDTVSVQWSCFLSQALGSRAQISVRFQDTDGTRGHNMQPDAFDRAWTFFAGRSTAD